MSFRVTGKDDPILELTLENDFILRFSVNDVAQAARDRLGEILEAEINRIIRETAVAERDRIQQGIKELLGIKGTGRQR
jgi:hypothetical protein